MLNYPGCLSHQQYIKFVWSQIFGSFGKSSKDPAVSKQPPVMISFLSSWSIKNIIDFQRLGNSSLKRQFNMFPKFERKNTKISTHTHDIYIYLQSIVLRKP